MELTPSQKKTVRHQFDSFCRKVLREEARDYERHIAWRSNHEVSLSELSEEQERQMYVLAYFLDMNDQEIADKLDMVRRTVQYKRAQSLKELKKEMEVNEDGTQSE